LEVCCAYLRAQRSDEKVFWFFFCKKRTRNKIKKENEHMAFDNIKLDKGLYCVGKSFTQALEELDPSENYHGTAMEGLDSYERQLKRFGIRVSGASSDRVEKFFQNANTATLFPEFVSRTVKKGLTEASQLESIVAATTQIDGNDYRSVRVAGEGASITAEGEEMASTMVRSRDNLVEMNKFGSVLNVTYETLRLHRIELLAVMLRKIGVSFAYNLMERAIDALLHGDGSVAEAAPVVNRSGSTLTYADLVSLWGSFSGFSMGAMITNQTTAQEILALPELRDGAAGLDFHGSGHLVTPLGAVLLVNSAVSGNQIIGVDNKSALEMVQAGGVITDYNRLIDRQFHRAGISTTVGFAKIFPDAVRVLA